MKPADLTKIKARLDAIVAAETTVLARCRLSEAPRGFIWTGPCRSPPLPFRYDTNKDRCRLCGQPIPGRATWHSDCVDVYWLWRKPENYAKPLILKQAGRCAISEQPLGPPLLDGFLTCDVDHAFPLYRVQRDMRDQPWTSVLPYWGLANLRAVTWKVHEDKSAEEAAERKEYRARQKEKRA